MIRCSHCGKLAPSGATSCQSCGMPMVAPGSKGSVGAARQGQQELPTWLESLRTHERPLANNKEQQPPFTMAELADENAMPSWMRQDQPKVIDTGNSDAFPALSSDMDAGQSFSAQGLEANSLIDEQSLPPWMRGEQGSVQPEAGQSISANSLVQPDMLPAWMQNLAQSAQPQTGPRSTTDQYGLPIQAPVTQSPRANLGELPQTPPVAPTHRNGMAQPPIPMQGISPNSLIDQQALPDWMTNLQGGNAPQPQGTSQPPMQGISPNSLIDQQALPNWMANLQGGNAPQRQEPPQQPPMQGISPNSLIDQQALPNWMTSQPGQDKSGSVSAMGVPVSGNGQGREQQNGVGGVGIPASNLLDMNSLPVWMRDDQQKSANAGFTPGAPSGGMVAGSLIDAGSVPEWMRNMDSTQQAGRSAQSMRVPSRPRGEIGGQEQSEAAANKFASMLGVPAPAPMVTNNSLGVAQMPQTPQQPPMSAWQGSQPPVASQSAQMQQWQMSSAASPGNASPFPGSYPPGGQGNSAMQGYAERPSGYVRGPEMRTTGNSSGNRNEVPAKKKGFFDAIRDFFFK